MKVCSLLLICIALLGCASIIDAQASNVQVVAVEMSRCPYCSLWKQSFQANVMSKDGLRDIIDMEEYFIATKVDTNITCMHGPSECVGNILLLCAANQTSAQVPWGWWDMGVCMQTDYQNIPDNAQACAEKVGLSWDTIYACSIGQLGVDLFDNSIAVSVGLGVKSTPTIFVDGREYVGGPNNPLAVICDAYKGTKPAGCSQ